MSIFKSSKLNNLLDDEMKEVFSIMFEENDMEQMKKNWINDRDLNKSDIEILKKGKERLLNLELEFYGTSFNGESTNDYDQSHPNKHKIVHINGFDWAKNNEKRNNKNIIKNDNIISNDEEDLER